MDELRTSRLLMRRWRSSDLEPFAALNADAEVMRYFPAPMARADSDDLVRRFEAGFDEHGIGRWALERRSDDAFIGFTGLGPMPDGVPGSGGWEVGWRLERRAWGQGLATEAGRAALRVAFEACSLAEVWSMTATANRPSRAVMERLGMTHVATADHPALAEGSPLRQHVFYRVSAAEWFAARSRSEPGGSPDRQPPPELGLHPEVVGE